MGSCSFQLTGRWIGSVILSTMAAAAAAADIPRCRLDNKQAQPVAQALRTALDAYARMGKPLPIERIAVNPVQRPDDGRVLQVLVVKDAARDGTNACTRTPARRDSELDEVSVREGCLALATDRPEIRCSADAVRIFGNTGQRPERPNPALLYVLAHELGHLHQKRAGEYAGRLDRLDLAAPREEKLRQLRDACEPGSTRLEAQADAMAVDVLKSVLPLPPYREPMFSEQGSVLWAMDRLYLAANEWQKAAVEREFVSQRRPHASFVPTEFPTPASTVERNAKAFVCEVLTRRRGAIDYPLKSVSHPPLEQRMRRAAEALKPVAAGLPSSGGREPFKALATLQEQLSPVFTYIYIETGVYMEGVRKAVCTRVNSEAPTAGCP